MEIGGPSSSLSSIDDVSIGGWALFISDDAELKSLTWILACKSQIDIQRGPSHYTETRLDFDSSGRTTVGKCLASDISYSSAATS